MDMAEKDVTEGRCPACRTPYNKERIVGTAAKCERYFHMLFYGLPILQFMNIKDVFDLGLQGFRNINTVLLWDFGIRFLKTQCILSFRCL